MKHKQFKFSRLQHCACAQRRRMTEQKDVWERRQRKKKRKRCKRKQRRKDGKVRSCEGKILEEKSITTYTTTWMTSKSPSYSCAIGGWADHGDIYARSTRTLSTGESSRFLLRRRTVVNEISPVSYAAKLNQKFLIHFSLKLREAFDSTHFFFRYIHHFASNIHAASEWRYNYCVRILPSIRFACVRIIASVFSSSLSFLSLLSMQHAGTRRIFLCPMCARARAFVDVFWRYYYIFYVCL